MSRNLILVSGLNLNQKNHNTYLQTWRFIVKSGHIWIQGCEPDLLDPFVEHDLENPPINGGSNGNIIELGVGSFSTPRLITVCIQMLQTSFDGDITDHGFACCQGRT